MPTTACNTHCPMLLPGQALAHNGFCLQQSYCIAETPTSSGQALRLPRIAYTVVTVPTDKLGTRHAAGKWQ